MTFEVKLQVMGKQCVFITYSSLQIFENIKFETKKISEKK